MKFTVEIDRDSIKKNPNGGSTGPYFVRGPVCDDGNGSKRRSVQAMYSITPEPYYTFNYLPCKVCCSKCLSRFFKESLIEEDVVLYDEAHDEYYESSLTKCPVCEKDPDCDIVWEKLDGKGNIYL